MEVISLHEAHAKNIVENFTIIGNPDLEAGYLMRTVGCKLHKEIKLYVSEKTRGTMIWLGDDIIVGGTIKVLSVNQSIIITGGKAASGSAGILNVEMWSAGQTLFWGKGSSVNSALLRISGEGRSIIVGDDCMFADGIYLSTYDMHAIFDYHTKTPLNAPGDIILEPHVWLGRGVTMPKGAIVGLASIIGAQSVVTKNIPRMSVAAGAPAKVIRSGATWDRTSSIRPQTIRWISELMSNVSPISLDD